MYRKLNVKLLLIICNFSHDQNGKLLLLVASDGGCAWGTCGHAKSADLTPGTGLEEQEQDETGNWKCQNNTSTFYLHDLQNRFNHEIGRKSYFTDKIEMLVVVI